MNKPSPSYIQSMSLYVLILRRPLLQPMSRLHCVKLSKLALCATVLASHATRTANMLDRRQMSPYLMLSQYLVSLIRGRYVAYQLYSR